MVVLNIVAAMTALSHLTSALPAKVFSDKRTVSSLNEQAFEEAQQRDDTATRAFSAVPITTSAGKCLFVDELSGDFRANLTPVQVGDCDGTEEQNWDIITAGVHDNIADTMLIVSTLTNACFNFDPRRAAGNQVILFACGGRADGGGAVTNSQTFNYTGGAGPLSFTPLNAVGTCLTVTSANVVDQAACDSTDANQSFSFGSSSSTTSSNSTSTAGSTVSSTTAASNGTCSS